MIIAGLARWVTFVSQFNSRDQYEQDLEEFCPKKINLTIDDNI